MTKQKLLLDWMKNKKIFATHEVIKWGIDNYYTRADRTKYAFAEAGLIQKLEEGDKWLKGYMCKDAVYEFVSLGVEQKTLF